MSEEIERLRAALAEAERETQMGTKNNPGSYDCYANAAPDEPMFILLGRDKHAPMLVKLWAEMRELDGEMPAKVTEAIQCAGAMIRYRRDRMRTNQTGGVKDLDRLRDALAEAERKYHQNLTELAQVHLKELDRRDANQGEDMTPEGKVKAQVKDFLKARGAYFFMPVQTGYGAPTLDFLGCYYEKFFAIETKAPGKKLTPRQKFIVEEIKKAKGAVFVVDSAEPHGLYDLHLWFTETAKLWCLDHQGPL